MSYETTNFLPKEVTSRQAIEFAELLGYRRSGTYAHFGRRDLVSLSYFEDKDYQSWTAIGLLIGPSKDNGEILVHTRTSVGRSHYDFQMQNRTAREFRRRFGGRAVKDGGNGEGYDPGPAVPPAASGCHLAMQRLDWNLTRVNLYLHSESKPNKRIDLANAGKHWPHMRELNPDVFISNVLITYLVSAMEDYFKSSYVALLKYAERKASVLKGARLSGDQLALISSGTLTIEQAVAENLPFQRLSIIGKHFFDIDPKLDVLAPLKRPYRRRKVNLLERLDHLVDQRHALIHSMVIDVDVDRSELGKQIHDFTIGMSRIYEHITRHYSWPFELPISSNFPLRKWR